MLKTDEILELFKQDKLLVRAMDSSELSRDLNNRSKFYRDFSTWAKEVDMSMHEGLICASSTLLVAGEKIPTYKNIGFMINSDKAEIVHVSEEDSGSSGNTADGDFYAKKSDLSTLSELADKTRKEKLIYMNEVNINIKNDAIIGLFVNKAINDMPKAQILLAQEYYKMQTGQELPIFIYDTQKGSLEPLKMSEDEKKAFLLSMKGKLKTLDIKYDVDTDYTQETKQKTLYDTADKPTLKDILSKAIPMQNTTSKPQRQVLPKDPREPDR